MPVKADEGELVDTMHLSFNNYRSRRNKLIEMDNGKMVFIQITHNVVNPTFYFNVYLDTQQTANVSYTYTSSWTVTVLDYSTCQISTNEVFVFLLVGYTGSALYPNMAMVGLKFNTSNNAVTKYELIIEASGSNTTSDWSGYVGEVINIGTSYYVVIHGHYYRTAHSHHSNIVMVQFNGSALSMGALYSPDVAYVAPIIGFLNEAETEYYFITAISTDDTAKYYQATISTKAIILLATDGTAGHFPQDNTKTGFTYDLDGGIITNGTIITMYFAYSYRFNEVYGSYYLNKARFEQHLITFNTIISAGTVLEQNCRNYGEIGTISASPHDIQSFGIINNQTSYTIYFVNDLGEDYGGYQWGRLDITIDDWYNMSGADISVDTDYDMRDNPEFTLGEPTTLQCLTGIEPDGRYVWVDNLAHSAHSWIYLIEPLTVEWEMTITYTPPDTPLQTLTQYRFDVYITGNDIGRSDCALILFIDGISYQTFIPEAGFVDFIYITSIAGIHEFEFRLMDSNLVNVLTEDRIYLFRTITDNDGVEEGLLLLNIEFIMSILPVGLIAGGCAVLLFQITRHWVGFMGGLTFGVLLCCATNILPFYTIIIIVIIDLLLIIFARNNTGE